MIHRSSQISSNSPSSHHFRYIGFSKLQICWKYPIFWDYFKKIRWTLSSVWFSNLYVKPWGLWRVAVLPVTAPSSAERGLNEPVGANGCISTNTAWTEALISFSVTKCTGTHRNLLSLISFFHLCFSGQFAYVLWMQSTECYMLWRC